MAEGGRRPALLCYDGSAPARDAVARAGEVLAGGPAIALTVWESVGSAVLRHPLPGLTELGREVRELSTDVIETLDADVLARAEATAAEGAELAGRAGFDARPLAHRALGRAAERSEGTTWQAVLEVAAAEDAAVIVVGSRGRSGLGAALLGSVSYGVVHNGDRPVLVVPPATEG
jgi:nucleotide-binding universal stress UspA family protein